jgi:hypothetical protein
MKQLELIIGNGGRLREREELKGNTRFFLTNYSELKRKRIT